MSPQRYPAVILDESVPRSQKERAEAVIWSARRIVKEEKGRLTNAVSLDTKLDELTEDLKVAADPDEWAHEIEDEAIKVINDALPDEYVCTLTEGDVIVREVGHPSEEMG